MGWGRRGGDSLQGMFSIWVNKLFTNKMFSEITQVSHNLNWLLIINTH